VAPSGESLIQHVPLPTPSLKSGMTDELDEDRNDSWEQSRASMNLRIAMDGPVCVCVFKFKFLWWISDKVMYYLGEVDSKTKVTLENYFNKTRDCLVTE
jgi:hypothetical protein